MRPIGLMGQMGNSVFGALPIGPIGRISPISPILTPYKQPSAEFFSAEGAVKSFPFSAFRFPFVRSRSRQYSQHSRSNHQPLYMHQRTLVVHKSYDLWHYHKRHANNQQYYTIL